VRTEQQRLVGCDRRGSGEGPRGGGHDLVVRHVAQMLADVPAVPERVLELAVPVAPEHVLQRLTHLRAGRDRLREHRLGVDDVEREDDSGPADRRRASTPISGNSSARCRRPPPMRNRTDISRPSGVGIRLSSSAPKASR
jgi:hypothetical protein